MKVTFTAVILGLLAAGTLAAWVVSGDWEGSALTGFTFLVSLATAYVGVCLSFIITGCTWAPPFVRQAVPLAFIPLALGVVLSFPAVEAADTFHRPEYPWFASSAVLARAAIGCAVLLVLALVARRRPQGFFATVFLIAFLLFNTTFSWDFGMTLQEHWHDTVFAPLWVLGSIQAGLGLLILYGATRALPYPLGAEDFDRFGGFLLAFSLLHGYLLYAQFLTVWYGNIPHERHALHERLEGYYAPLFWIVIVVTVAAPILLNVFRPFRRSRTACGVLAAVVLIGLWLERLWMILPARHVGH